MTTPTPRTDATDYFDMIVHARQLERDLAAAQEALAEAESAKRALGRVADKDRAIAREAQEALRFVERWANHHGVKPCVKPEHALSTIQHYPPILAITESYADGKVPETRNPWAELAAAQSEITSLTANLSARNAEILEAQEARERAEELAQRSTSRLVEMTEPGFIGAFAARDHWKERAERAEALAESYKADAERLDWLHARAFTIYRTRDPESKALSIHVTIVDEDAKGTRTGITAPTIRAAIDSAMATRV